MSGFKTVAGRSYCWSQKKNRSWDVNKIVLLWNNIVMSDALLLEAYKNDVRPSFEHMTPLYKEKDLP